MTVELDNLTSREPTQARGRRRVSAIRDATLRLLASSGDIRAMKVSDVAREAGVAVGTIYHYFPSKEALLLDLRREIMDAAAHDLATSFAERFRETGAFRDAMYVMVDRWVDLSLNYKGLARGIQGLIFENAAVAALIDAQEEQLRMFVSRLIASYSWTLRPCDPDQSAFMLFTLVDAAVVRIMRDPTLAKRPRWVVDEVVRMLDHYLIPDTPEPSREP